MNVNKHRYLIIFDNFFVVVIIIVTIIIIYSFLSNVYLLIAFICLITNSTDTITDTDDIYSIFDL